MSFFVRAPGCRGAGRCHKVSQVFFVTLIPRAVIFVFKAVYLAGWAFPLPLLRSCLKTQKRWAKKNPPRLVMAGADMGFWIWRAD